MNSLETKIQRKNIAFQGDMAKFLKRRRIELGLKLDDLSEGICSVSYLSRIENNMVEVDDSYFKLLCEKMEINYEDVKKDRSRNIYIELLKEYISNNFDGVSLLVSHAIESKSYVDTELELILLFDNVVKGIYEESRKLLIKLERISEQLSNPELLFFMYCYTLYAYKTNQNRRAYKNIIIMTNVIYEDSFFEACVYDLAMDIMAVVNYKEMWWKFYNKFEKLATSPMFRHRLNLHKLQMLEIESFIFLDNVIDEFTNLGNYFDLSNYETGENYYYYLARCYYNNKQYDKAVETIFKIKPSMRMTSILVSCLLHIHDMEKINDIFNLLNNLRFNKYDKMYQDYYMFIKLMMEGNNHYVLYNYYRTILTTNDEFYDGFIENEKEKLYIDIICGCSKYKEGIKYWKKISELTLHDKLK